MMICSICRCPIEHHETCVKLEGRWVHTRHHGVKERVAPAEITIGGCIATLRKLPVKHWRKRWTERNT